jgi:peptide/nickel transport system permease protein
MSESIKQELSRSFWGNVSHRFFKNSRGVIGLIFVVAMILISIFSSLIASDQPIVCRYEEKLYFPAIVEIFQLRNTNMHWINKSKPFRYPSFEAREGLDPDAFAIWPLIPYSEFDQTNHFSQPPSIRHWLGTDGLGRDIAARMIHGTSVAVQVGFISMGIASVIGIFLGGLAGYYGGWIDIIISRVIEVVICFPVFFLILSILVWLDPSIINVMIVLGLTRWTSIARYTRGEFLRLKGQDFVMAAQAMGLSNMRIMFKHILPNALAPVMVSITFGIAAAILIESALSWLGFGVQAPAPSWGNLLRTGYDSLRDAPYMVYPPCVAIFIAVMAYNLVGDALRDAIDPRLK